MRITKKKAIITLLILTSLAFFSYYLNEAYRFANGVKNDYIKKDSALKAKGTRLDSMGNVNIEDYRKIRVCLETKRK